MKSIVHHLHRYRFEVLLITLLMVLFNKIFFVQEELYQHYVWPFNLVMLGVASLGIFKEHNRWLRAVKNVLLVAGLTIPFLVSVIFTSKTLTLLAIGVYMLYYSWIWVEVLRQITRKGEITVSLVFGSLSGYLLLMVVALFTFLLLAYLQPGAFGGLTGTSIPETYRQLSYFSMITIATVGYGDIVPVSDSARLLAAFFSICGQFYMVTLVGIIISKFSSKTT
jgi:voltage-gated potassium channel